MSEAIIPVVMPKWGLSMREGTVNEWLVEEGQEIVPGMPILNVETDKIANAVEATDGGVLRRKVAEEGDMLPVKALLGVLAPPTVSDGQIDDFIQSWVVPEEEGDGDEPVSADQFIEADGLRVRYIRKGEGAETLLFIHGFGGDLDNWLFNLDAFPDATVVALDLPAHGRTETRLTGSSLSALARFVAEFMQALAIPSAHLIGHSLGGAVAAQLALDAPQQVRSLALIGSAGFGPEVNRSYTQGFIDAQSRRDLKPVVELLFADAALVSRQLLDDLLKYKRLDGVTDCLQQLHDTLFSADGQTALPGRRLNGEIPLLLIWGEEDAIIPPSHAERAPAGSRVERIAGAGHMPQMEQSAQVNRLLQQHISGG
ncbi:acetoin dehydrogenase dihydrolipoyllysine-residue acetyltransferase subunit [Enterobacter cloacae complex sp. P29RS]|uniref:acetoin dehydrogenase dihydrolipoyllysine-residue acetyltransferase subunit n=1 Tax=Enterobacter cloacae complex sp. P29RS TaxID=2779563 RepID=UPI001866B812|nr:acetoin dehydrogenase dihydrolipoyllysine-residue acetyltransferase subunit [Enterobacter cloacae complex sp. P29RS]MBE3175382.1 acetoin dehydrogenase dihydrolipoyllysine-residue acetyltransferase subunit [Enterobacter cloacae complex sp. P29RS]